MAKVYDEKWMPKGGVPREVNERESVFENMNVKDRLFLDLGAGTLRLSLDAIEKGVKHVVAVDMLRDMLEWGMRKSEKLRAKPKIDVVVADVRYLPFLNEAFDAAAAIELFEHLPDGRRLFMNEVHRVLKPAGTAAVNTWNAIPRMLAGLLGYTEKGIEARKVRASRPNYWENYYRYFYFWEFKAFMQSTSFKKVRILGVHSTYFVPHFEMMTSTQISRMSKPLKILFKLQILSDRLLRKIKPLNQITGKFLLAVLEK